MDPYGSADKRAPAPHLRRHAMERFTETGILAVFGSRETYRICTRDLTRVLDAQTRRPRASAFLQLTVPASAHDLILSFRRKIVDALQDIRACRSNAGCV